MKILNNVSVVIRNKNEGDHLKEVLDILVKIYKEDISEIIIVDDHSTDNSREIAQAFGCKIVEIDRFSYGRGLNLGIKEAKSNFVLVLSAHAIPIGDNFFKNSLALFGKYDKVAGVRFINSFENYRRAIENNFVILNPIEFGLNAACALINKNIWEDFKFDEELIALEDKEWSKRVVKEGFKIVEARETYFYFINRDYKAIRNRYKNETLVSYKMAKEKFTSPIHSILSFFKKIFLTNVVIFFKTSLRDFQNLKTKLEIYNMLKDDGTE